MPVPGAAGCARSHQTRFSTAWRRPGLQPRTQGSSSVRRCPARRWHRRAAGDRGGGRPRDGGARRGSRRHHADAAGADARIYQDPKAVRPSPVGQSGDPPPPRRYGDELRRGAIDGAARGTDGRRRAGRARSCRLGRQGQDRQMRPLRRRAIGAASWRDGRHRRARYRFLLQAAAGLRHVVRRQRPSLSPSRRIGRPDLFKYRRSATWI